jgi:general secretion pathway protein K
VATRLTALPHPVSRSRFRFGSNSSDTGFALVAVIWSLGLITLLGMAVMVGARYRAKVTSTLASVAAAAAAAESAINLGIISAVTAKPGQNLKFPLQCRMPGGERVTVTVEEEVGKIDLNTATSAVLARLFTALTRDQSAGARIAGSIVAFRDGGQSDTATRSGNNKPEAARKPGFLTIMQLDQIDGIFPDLFRMALRFVTVRSGRPEPDADAASPALRDLLELEQKPASPARGLPAGGSVTIRADVRDPDGARFIREALVSLGVENGKPFVIREWRHGYVDSEAFAHTTERREDPELRESRCFRTKDAVRS